MSWHEERFEAMEGRIQTSCVMCARLMWLPKSKVDKYKTCGGECSKKLRHMDELKAINLTLERIYG